MRESRRHLVSNSRNSFASTYIDGPAKSDGLPKCIRLIRDKNPSTERPNRKEGCFSIPYTNALYFMDQKENVYCSIFSLIAVMIVSLDNTRKPLMTLKKFRSVLFNPESPCIADDLFNSKLSFLFFFFFFVVGS